MLIEKLLAPKMRGLYYSMAPIMTPNADNLSRTKRCIIVNNGSYLEMVAKFVKIVEFTINLNILTPESKCWSSCDGPIHILSNPKIHNFSIQGDSRFFKTITWRSCTSKNFILTIFIIAYCYQNISSHNLVPLYQNMDCKYGCR